VSAGEDDEYACGLRTDGSITCWGDGFWGELAVPGSPFVSSAGGGYWSDCGLRADGTIVCVGPAQQNQPTGRDFSAVTLGSVFGCGLRRSGAITCWSSGGRGPFGPTAKGGYRAVSAGEGSVCALTAEERIVCVGGISAPPGGKFVQVSVGTSYGADFGCGVRPSGRLVCWGDDTGPYGGSEGVTDPPTGKFKVVRAGGYNACGVRQDGDAVCWGQNYFGGPAQPLSGQFVDIQPGGIHGPLCGLRPSHRISCVGDDQGPVPWTHGRYKEISVGWGDDEEPGDLCAVHENGDLQCWGVQGLTVPAARP